MDEPATAVVEMDSVKIERGLDLKLDGLKLVWILVGLKLAVWKLKVERFKVGWFEDGLKTGWFEVESLKVYNLKVRC